MMDRKLHQSSAKDSMYKKLQAYRVKGVLDDINRENENENDRRSAHNSCNCVKKPEKKFRTSTGFEPLT